MEEKTVQNKTDELMQTIDKGVQAFLTSNKYQEMLKELSRFKNYSFNNRMLILMQNPEATLVNSYNRWKSLGRYVKANEKSLKILAPNTKKYKKVEIQIDEDGNETEKIVEKQYTKGFHAVSVFDISQTDGKELQMDKICEDLTGDVEDFDSFLKAAETMVDIPINIKDTTPGITAKGYCSVSEIVIYKNSGLQMFKTLVHELAHVMLGHTKPSCEIPRDEKECQAESVAFMVASSLGYDVSNYSFEYIGTWDGSKGGLDGVKKNLTDIVKVVDNVLDCFAKRKALN